MLTEHEIQKNKEEIIALLQSTQREGMPKLIKYLEGTDFFVAPASTKYHNSFSGGLAQHSLTVYRNLLGMSKHLKLDLPVDSIIICTLLHDVCKAGVYHYEAYKTYAGGKWKFEDNFPVGHGEKSVFLLMRFIELSEKEIILVRWHMGPEDAGGYYQKMSLDNARNLYPELTAIMCADLIASFIIETREPK